MDRVISILASAIIDVVEFRWVWDRIEPIPRNTTDKCSEYNPKIVPFTDLHTWWYSSYFSSTKRSSYKNYSSLCSLSHTIWTELHKAHVATQNSLSWIHVAVENYLIFGHPVEDQVIWVELNVKCRIKNVLKFRELLVMKGFTQKDTPVPMHWYMYRFHHIE